MRRFLSLVLLVPSLLAAQVGRTGNPACPDGQDCLSYDLRLRGEVRGGAPLIIDIPAGLDADVIVEFRDAPLVLQPQRTRRVSEMYRQTFDRFRADLASILAPGRRSVEPDVRWEYFETFNGVSVTVPRAKLDAIRALPYVKRVHPDVTVRALADSVPPENVRAVRADQLWANFGTRGAGVVIAIIDTGIDYTHPALGGGFGPGFRVIGGYDFVNKDDDPMDDHFHGTHVSGIAAGNTSDFLGVAPDAKLIAFKVLNANGSGKESDVLAAIERTVDPNGDGDTSDHVDVANLSLGGSGNPDDPQSAAIDNATAAGVVFAVAAGNSGAAHTIGSPGTSRRAITVGAVDLADQLASFSSRGPNMKDLAVKPEVLAPGVSIRSSLPKGTYGSLSGTSMATPHIAGVAALLKAVHPNWTPAQIKSAIVNTANDLHLDLMAQGAGRADANAAAGNTVFVDPPVFNLGIDPPKSESWTSSKTVHVTNAGSQSVSITMTPPVVGGVTVSLSPATVSLSAGESRDVTMSVDVKNLLTAGRANTFSVGAQLPFFGTQAVHVPFGFTRAARVTVDYDRGLPTTLWISPSGFDIAAPISDLSSEFIVKPGTFDFFLYSLAQDAKTGVLSDARVIYRENQTIDGDMHLAVSGDEAKHLITFDGRDENNARLADRLPWYLSFGRLILHSDWALSSLALPDIPVASLRISDLGLPKLLVGEELFDKDNRHLVVVQHPQITSPSADVTVRNDPSALRTAKVRLFVPPWGRTSTTSVTTSEVVPTQYDDVNSPAGLLLRNDSVGEVDWTMAMTPDATSSYGMKATFAVAADSGTWYISPNLAVVGDRIVARNAAGWSYDGGTFTFGFGPNLPVTRVNALIPAGNPPPPPGAAVVVTSYVGQFGESRPVDARTSVTTSFDGSGKQLGTINGITTPLSLDVSKRGPFTVNVAQNGLMLGAVARKTTLSLSFDSTRTDFSPPTFTSLLLVDGNGRATERLDPHGIGSLLFSIADYLNGINSNGSYQQIRPEATAVSYRVSGTAAWQPLTAVRVDENTNGAGILYRTDLQSVTNADRALIDLKIDATDVAGNTASLVVAPVFSVGVEVPPRRHAAGK